MSELQVHMRRLPLATLYLTERCNSRCLTCDYWRHGQIDISLPTINALLPDFERMGTKVVVLSGGEPLIHPEWPAIAELLHARGLELWLLTSGLSLAKHAARAARYCKNITVSLDGADAPTYAAIRGVDAFDKVCEGIQAALACGASVSIRVTVQRANFRQLPQFVALARRLQVREVSFLAVDVANPHAFGRTQAFEDNLALGRSDLAEFDGVLRELEMTEADAFERHLIAESPAKLRRILRYFAALHGDNAFPQVRCNAPEFSAVIDAAGRVRPCFFIAGPPRSTLRHGVDGDKLYSVLNGAGMAALRATIRAGERRECRSCVCSLYRPEYAQS